MFIIGIVYSKTLYECTNGINPNTLTNKQYLIEFSKGGCSPVIIVPPLTGVRLYFQMLDCEVFKSNNPYIFKTCGWTHCQKKIYEFWKKVPSKEYPLWISNLFTPMSLLSYKKSSSNCLAALVTVKVDFNKSPEESIMETKGYRITYKGNTPGTQQQNDCGERASNEILPDQLQPILKQKIWQLFLDQMLYRGYKRGLTYQFLPYDFRISIVNNQLNKLFQPNLQRIFSLTGKKSYIISWSYGVNNSYHQILKLSKKQKKMVKGLIGFGGNFMGTIQADLSLLTPWDYYKVGPFGLHYQAGLDIQQNFICVYENTLRDPYSIFKDQEFMKEIKKRMDYERGQVQKDDSIFNEFLPDLNQKCSPDQYDFFGNNCKLGFPKEDIGVMMIDGQIYKRNQMNQMIKDRVTNPDVYKFWTKFYQKEFFELKNPQVPVILFNLRTQKTPIAYKIDNYEEYFRKKKYIKTETQFAQGDGVVPSMSLNIAALKWAYEYTTQSIEGAQPIKIIDVCGLYNQNKSIYDSIDKNGQKQIKKNDFIGLNCQCINDKDPSKCIHSYLVSDPNHAEYFGKIIESGDISYTQEYEEHVNKLDDQALEDMIKSDCPQLKT